MANYWIRYGRVIPGDAQYESVRIEIEEEFDSETTPDRLTAVQQVAREVESICVLREKYPEKFV